jgi:hypothetical protein
MKRELSFFATYRDMTLFLELLEEKEQLAYTLSGLFDSPNFSTFRGYTEIPNLGVSASGNRNLDPSYLVSHKGETINLRPVSQRRGGEKFAVDQLVNQTSIVFHPSGLYGGNCLITGQVGTISENPSSIKLYKDFATTIQSRFNKIKSYFVGEEAACLLSNGGRLTSNIKSPLDYDLKLD